MMGGLEEGLQGREGRLREETERSVTTEGEGREWLYGASTWK